MIPYFLLATIIISAKAFFTSPAIIICPKQSRRTTLLRMSVTNEDLLLETPFVNNSSISKQKPQASTNKIQPWFFDNDSIDSGRYVFTSDSPERLLSALEYSSETKQMIRKQGNVWASAALVAGTTVGAGVLALPAATVSAGFIPSTAALVTAWIIMTASGLFIAELTLNRWVTTGKPGLGLLELFDALGNPWKLIGSAAYFFLHYAMMVAYIAQGGKILGTSLVNDQSGSLLFAILTSCSLFLASAKLIEQANNTMVLGVGASFLAIMVLGASSADWSLLATQQTDPFAVISCFPILFLSLVYQNIVPTVVQQLEGDSRKITMALVTGTTIPLVMFVAWNAVVCANVPSGVTNVDPILLLQQEGGGFLSPLVTTFSSLALLTSIIGFTYGLLDAWTDVFQWRLDQLDESKKMALFALIYVPPTLLALSNPDIFFQALDYGGAFGVSTLFLVLPPLLVWQERYQQNTPLATPPLVPGGKVPVVAMLGVAVTLILQQGVDKFGSLIGI